ncbi:hypothetical protein GQ457_10G023370 [Hibiscus cannabinus]
MLCNTCGSRYRLGKTLENYAPKVYNNDAKRKRKHMAESRVTNNANNSSSGPRGYYASTPLWRNGPPEKPVLCNACGSRYRIGKSLENYTPKLCNIDAKRKRKQMTESTVTKNGSNSSSGHGGYYASSESSTSHYPNCVTVKQEVPDDHPVENLESSWKNHSKKRSKVVYSSNLTTIQQLQKDLHGVLRDEFNGTIESEDVMIYNLNHNKLQFSPIEIGLGAILLKSHVSSPDHQDQQKIRASPPNHTPSDMFDWNWIVITQHVGCDGNVVVDGLARLSRRSNHGEVLFSQPSTEVLSLFNIDRGTPLWRNGPPEKPVLCNACGSRYRLGKPLENYAPKVSNIDEKRKRKHVTESTMTNNVSDSSSGPEGYYASSESSTSHYPNCVTAKQDVPDDHPVENWENSWKTHSRKRSKVPYSSNLTTVQQLQKDLHSVLRDEFNGTPLWRNGQPEKPVLCNACGSRYRLGKTLENYTPKVCNNDAKRKRKHMAESTVTNNANNSSYGPEGYYASSESSTSHYPNCVTAKQETPDDHPDSVLKMKKQGPCFHCGVDSTPLWRNGPPEKPVLCNACGSRYRLGKPLENYTPKVYNIDAKRKRKHMAESTVTNNGSKSSSGPGGYYASSESSTSHYSNCVTAKQEAPDDHPEIGLGAILLNSPVSSQDQQDQQKIRASPPNNAPTAPPK